MKSERAVLSWSGGKDSALALAALRRPGKYSVAALLTTARASDRKISLHHVPVALIRAQARAAGLPLKIGWLKGATDYETVFGGALASFRKKGLRRAAFGDLFLEDIRAYREKLLVRLGWRCIFPVWGIDTKKLAFDFIAAGFRALVTCVDSSKLGPAFAGREFDASFLSDLPRKADPCGENGEFHTFVYDGPIFKHPVKFRKGRRRAIVYRAPGHDFKGTVCELHSIP